MVIVHFLTQNTVIQVEGPFADAETARAYLEQRDHLKICQTQVIPLVPARFAPDMSYLDAA